MIKKGDEWAVAAGGPPDLVVTGGDAELAAAVREHLGARVAFSPDASDLALAVGLTGPPGGASEVAVDAMLLHDQLPEARFVVNMVVAGTPPDHVRRYTRSRRVEIRVDGRPVFAGRATTVIIANGQFRHGLDLVPNGHPGDGRLEVQVYALPVAARRSMRRRLAAGTHVPHPAITVARGRRVDLDLDPGFLIDGDLVGLAGSSPRFVEVVPSAFRLLL